MCFAVVAVFGVEERAVALGVFAVHRGVDDVRNGQSRARPELRWAAEHAGMQMLRHKKLVL